jgi:hypothetical protein
MPVRKIAFSALAALTITMPAYAQGGGGGGGEAQEPATLALERQPARAELPLRRVLRAARHLAIHRPARTLSSKPNRFSRMRRTQQPAAQTPGHLRVEAVPFARLALGWGTPPTASRSGRRASAWDHLRIPPGPRSERSWTAWSALIKNQPAT